MENSSSLHSYKFYYLLNRSSSSSSLFILRMLRWGVAIIYCSLVGFIYSNRQNNEKCTFIGRNKRVRLAVIFLKIHFFAWRFYNFSIFLLSRTAKLLFFFRHISLIFTFIWIILVKPSESLDWRSDKIRFLKSLILQKNWVWIELKFFFGAKFYFYYK